MTILETLQLIYPAAAFVTFFVSIAYFGTDPLDEDGIGVGAALLFAALWPVVLAMCIGFGLGRLISRVRRRFNDG